MTDAQDRAFDRADEIQDRERLGLLNVHYERELKCDRGDDLSDALNLIDKASRLLGDEHTDAKLHLSVAHTLLTRETPEYRALVASYVGEPLRVAK